MKVPSTSAQPATLSDWPVLFGRQPITPPAPDEIAWHWHRLEQSWLQVRCCMGLNSGWAGISWSPNALHFQMVFFGLGQKNRAARLNERTWELGSVAEVFLQADGTGDYLEIHLTPENHRLQLCWTSDGLARVRQRTAKLEDYMVPNPNWVLSAAKCEEESWSGVITVPAASLGLPEFHVGQILRAAVCRYHYGTSGEPQLSTTAPLPSPAFHQPAHWNVIKLTDSNSTAPLTPANCSSAVRPALRPDYTPAQLAVWLQCYDEQRHLARQGRGDVVFLGDSITAGWSTHGLRTWEEFFVPLRSVCFGIPGDRTQQVLWRVHNGTLNGLSPEVVVLLIGTNNLDPGLGTNNLTRRNTGPEIVAGITAVVESLRQLLPRTRVLLMGLLPRRPADDPIRREIMAINDRLRSFFGESREIVFIDAGPCLLQSDGSIDLTHMPDQLHPSASGYRLLAKQIIGPLKSLMDLQHQG
jgi:lysophospholipase L1-like esterase